MAEMKASTTASAGARHIRGALRRYVSVAAVSAGIILLAACSSSVDAFGRAKFMFGGFQVSPNGRMVAFSYCDAAFRYCRLGLLDLTTDRIVPVPGPAGKQLKHPSFSYDGKRLAAVMGNPDTREGSQIVIIDLATLNITQVTEGSAPRLYPVFQPGTDNILYVVGGHLVAKYHLRLLDLSRRTETTVLEKKDGFLAGIFQPSFVRSTEIIFQAIAPADPALKQAVVNLVGTETADIAFRLRFGGRPEILLPQIESLRKVSYEPGISFLSASQNGKELVFIHPSTAEPSTKGVGYNYEIFRLENGNLKPLTNLRSHLAHAHLSYDGSTVAFGSDPKRRRQWDLFILEMKTGRIRQTHLLERLAKHPDFALQ